MKDPYEIIKAHYVTEKSTMLAGFHTAEKNRPRSLQKCKGPKYVFVVDRDAIRVKLPRLWKKFIKSKK